MRYTKEQIIAALALYNAIGLAKEVIKTLGYPSNPTLCHWIEKYPEFLSKPHVRHYKQATAELKKQVRGYSHSGSGREAHDSLGS